MKVYIVMKNDNVDKVFLGYEAADRYKWELNRGWNRSWVIEKEITED